MQSCWIALSVLSLLALHTHGDASSSTTHPRIILLRSRTIDTALTPPATPSDRRTAAEAQTWLVHLESVAHREAVEQQLGVHFEGYLPHNTFMLHASAATAEALVTIPQVLWSRPLASIDKIDPALQELAHGQRSVQLDVVLSEEPIDLAVAADSLSRLLYLIDRRLQATQRTTAQRVPQRCLVIVRLCSTVS